MSKIKLQAKILTPESSVYEGPATAVTATNDTGEFSILPNHTSFIAVIHDKITVHKPDKSKESWTVGKGIISCSDNQIEVYAEKIVPDK